MKKTSCWEVHKFGGTSLADHTCYENVARIVTSYSSQCSRAVVVSAMAGVTDGLIEVMELAQNQKKSYLSFLSKVKQKHFDVIDQLLDVDDQNKMKAILDADFVDIEDILRTVWLGKSATEHTLELITGYGEIWSAQILQTYLSTQKKVSASWLNAREVLVVTPNDAGAAVEWDQSQKKLDRHLKNEKSQYLVITGYVASTEDGVPTTLKRNGSDFSAAIFGKLLSADSITIWTDVDGVLSADPRCVPEAVVLDELSYQEAMELAYFGAKIIHPHTMSPAIEKSIPLYIRNSFNSDFPGTKITKKSEISSHKDLIKGVSTVDEMALVNIEGTGMIGVPGIANRLFGAMKEVGVSVVMISQASSEHSICFAVPSKQSKLAKKTVEKEFFREIHHSQVQTVEVVEPCSIVAAVGDNMIDVPGVASKFFSALGKAGVNIRAIAQGSSERNISAVIDQKEVKKAVRAVHSSFYLSDQTLSVGLIGPGQIGSALLKQIEDQKETLKKEFNVDLRVRAIANSKKMLLEDKQVDLTQWKNSFDKKSAALNMDQFISHVKTDRLPHCVMIDCTASEKVADYYSDWLEKGVHIVTPNKKANSSEFKLYQNLHNLHKKYHTHYFYEATVGAGLPVITTLKDLIQTGDQIIQIEGVFSGTLSYIFNTFSGDQSFSQVVLDAKQNGYTEPDPRDDLSGMDVARKVIILAREMGLSLEIDQISVENLVSKELQKIKSVDDFMKKLSEMDPSMNEKQVQAQEKNEVLRYVGVVNPNGKSSVELRTYAKDHPFARISGSDNIIAFRTKRYDQQPLIIQGPGAGPAVTAAGVFADLIRLSSLVGQGK